MCLNKLYIDIVPCSYLCSTTFLSPQSYTFWEYTLRCNKWWTETYTVEQNNAVYQNTNPYWNLFECCKTIMRCYLSSQQYCFCTHVVTELNWSLSWQLLLNEIAKHTKAIPVFLFGFCIHTPVHRGNGTIEKFSHTEYSYGSTISIW